MFTTGYIRLKVVVLKDQRNKRAHEQSAQLACEAAGAIRTVASLTREEDCLRLYSESLEEPLRRSNRTALWSNLIYAMSQAMTFFVIALIFWYGSRLVSYGEISTFHFFVALMVRLLLPSESSVVETNYAARRARHLVQTKQEMFSSLCPMFHLLRVLLRTFSLSSTRSLKSTRCHRRVRNPPMSKDKFASKR